MAPAAKHSMLTMNQSLQSAAGIVPPVFLLAPRARVADFRNPIARHAFTATDSDADPEAHRGGYEQG